MISPCGMSRFFSIHLNKTSFVKIWKHKSALLNNCRIIDRCILDCHFGALYTDVSKGMPTSLIYVNFGKKTCFLCFSFNCFSFIFFKMCGFWWKININIVLLSKLAFQQGSRYSFIYVVHWTSKFWILWNYRVRLKFMWSRNCKLQNQCVTIHTAVYVTVLSKIRPSKTNYYSVSFTPDYLR